MTYITDPSLAVIVKPYDDYTENKWFFQEYALSVLNTRPLEIDKSFPVRYADFVVTANLKGGLGNQMFQIATAYGIIYVENGNNIPRIKAVVYSPTSDTYYVHTNDLDFLNYLLPRLQKFFLTPQFGFENFTMSYDWIDQENFVLEVNIKDESTILNNVFFKVPLTTI
jgi:hypothetical protein